jgi:hypothetical protein
MRKDLVIIPDDTPGQLAGSARCSAPPDQHRGDQRLHRPGQGDRARPRRSRRRRPRGAARRRYRRPGGPAGRSGPLPDEPGHLGAACRTLADADVNIEQAYIAAGSKLVIVCDDVDRAKELLGVADA